MIAIQNVSFSYGPQRQELQTLDFKVRKGECILLCGTSGCGKTTVTKLINGLIPHFAPAGTLEGEVQAAGLKVGETELYEIAKQVGSVFQNPKSQFFNLDTESELAFGLENEGAERAYIKERIQETVAQLDLQSLLGRGIFELSGGEKQMLAFASVYAMNPEIFVLDEPTANLDTVSIEKIRQQIELLKAQGKTILIAEHRLYFLLDVIDRALYLEDGRLSRSFSPAEFRALTAAERTKLGLRTLVKEHAKLPPAAKEADKGLVVQTLTVAFKKRPPVLTKLSFAVAPGDVLAITGKNGTGKTTLVKCLCGLIKAASGTIHLDGHPLNAKERQRQAFCVMQDVNHQLFSDSVLGECQLSGNAATPAEIENVLTALNLWEWRNQHPMALSGGQKQRLAIATALLSDKKIMIFDEPTSGLDYGQMRNVVKIIQQLQKAGKIILVVSHDQEFLAAVCNRVLEI